MRLVLPFIYRRVLFQCTIRNRVICNIVLLLSLPYQDYQIVKSMYHQCIARPCCNASATLHISLFIWYRFKFAMSVSDTPPPPTPPPTHYIVIEIMSPLHVIPAWKGTHNRLNLSQAYVPTRSHNRSHKWPRSQFLSPTCVIRGCTNDRDPKSCVIPGRADDRHPKSCHRHVSYRVAQMTEIPSRVTDTCHTELRRWPISQVVSPIRVIPGRADDRDPKSCHRHVSYRVAQLTDIPSRVTDTCHTGLRRWPISQVVSPTRVIPGCADDRYPKSCHQHVSYLWPRHAGIRHV